MSTPQCFLINMNGMVPQNMTANINDAKPPLLKDKVKSYEEKSVGSTAFFQCEACPYMALAEDDIKFHLFTVHLDLARTNGLADNIQIPCPGCTSIFDAEETLRTHLRNHHKMGIKDMKKMVKSLVQIALKNAKLKKEDKSEPSSASEVVNKPQEIPQVIEISPDIVNPSNVSLPQGVAFISVDELQKMSMPNFEKLDPKEIIQEASINIVYTNEVTTQYMNVTKAASSSAPCNFIQMPNVTPDLISSIQPRTQYASCSMSIAQQKDNKLSPLLPSSDMIKLPPLNNSHSYNFVENETKKVREKPKGKPCSVNDCNVRLEDEEKLMYHRKCHQNGTLQCPECGRLCNNVEVLHTHLWKIHAIDMELHCCEICGTYKTYNKNRLKNIHMKSHGTVKAYKCSICSKAFKNSKQLSKHRMIHKKVKVRVQCSLCELEFSCEQRLNVHVATVHDKIKPFKCTECDYAAARKVELNLHLRSHTGEKPYSCDKCSYKSGDHNAIRRHKKQHTMESNYKCKYCPYTTIQSTLYISHLFSNHPDSNDVHQCPYCLFKSVNKDKFLSHLSKHTDKEGIQVLIRMVKGASPATRSWTIPSENEDSPTKSLKSAEETMNSSPKGPNTMRSPVPVEIDPVVYDCETDNPSNELPHDFSKNHCINQNSEEQRADFSDQSIVTDLSKDDNNSDFISESSNDTLIDRQYPPQCSLQNLQNITYENTQPTLHPFLGPSVTMEQSLIQNTNVSSITSNHTLISNNIMSNFPIRLPHLPQISVRDNIMLKPVDKITGPMTKVTGPIILPVPSSSYSPGNSPIELEGAPRKKPKISVKSNLILKGPDQVDMFHSQQKMAFKRLEDSERFGLRPVTFNNLIPTQFMQLQSDPPLSESPNTILTYNQTSTTPEDSRVTDSPQMYTFSTVNSMTMLPPPRKIQANDPSYIKLEATVKPNTQSPGLESMCSPNIMNTQPVNREYKASPPLEDIHKNMADIKNEVKSDYYNIALNNSATNAPILDQYLIDNIIGEQYVGHLDPSASIEVPVEQQNDVIEIDDNSDDNKLLSRFDINHYPLESLYMMHDYHFLENEVQPTTNEGNVIEINDGMTINQKENVNIVPVESSNDMPNFIQGKKDPMMNTSVRPSTNKINVKNIELMKN